MLSAKLADVSESFFVNFYRNEGTAIMGLPADKLKDIKDQGDIQVINDTFHDRLYRRFGLIIKPKVTESF
jgi:predicted acetyltransferase